MSLGSFSILAWLAGGVIIGALLQSRRWQKAVDGAITAGVALILFFMGVSLGSGPDLLRDLAQVGLPAAVMALCTVGGSVLVVWLLSRLFSRKEDKP